VPTARSSAVEKTPEREQRGSGRPYPRSTRPLRLRTSPVHRKIIAYIRTLREEHRGWEGEDQAPPGCVTVLENTFPGSR